MSALSLMALPFLECLILVGIHSYLGLHVIRRRVIFVDLALAQVAALGTTIAFLFGLNPHSTGAYVFSLSFTFLGAAVFSLTRLRNDRVPQEAVIGLSYALAASIGVLAIFGAPHGAEHIQNISTGALLWVSAEDVREAAIAYSFVGIIHFVFRDRFRLISENPEEAHRQGISVRWWDFLFYLLFGLVITHSVQTAGVLLVFVFLVVPAILGVMLTDRMGLQLAIGWGVGTVVSVLGLAASYYGDLPSGPTVVAAYGLALLGVALAVYVIRAKRRIRALGHVALGTVVVAVLAVGFIGAGRFMAGIPSLAQGPDHDHHAGHGAQKISEGHAQGHELVDDELDLAQRLVGMDLVEKKRLLRGLTNANELNQALDQSGDVEVRYALAERLLTLDRPRGARRLIDLMADSKTPPMFRDDALHALMDTFGACDQAFDPWAAPDTAENERAIAAWRIKATVGR